MLTLAGVSCGLGPGSAWLAAYLILLNPSQQDWERFSDKVQCRAGAWINTLVNAVFLFLQLKQPWEDPSDVNNLVIT